MWMLVPLILTGAAITVVTGQTVSVVCSASDMEVTVTGGVGKEIYVSGFKQCVTFPDGDTSKGIIPYADENCGTNTAPPYTVTVVVTEDANFLLNTDTKTPISCAPPTSVITEGNQLTVEKADETEQTDGFPVTSSLSFDPSDASDVGTPLTVEVSVTKVGDFPSTASIMSCTAACVSGSTDCTLATPITVFETCGTPNPIVTVFPSRSNDDLSPSFTMKSFALMDDSGREVNDVLLQCTVKLCASTPCTLDCARRRRREATGRNDTVTAAGFFTVITSHGKENVLTTEQCVEEFGVTVILSVLGALLIASLIAVIALIVVVVRRGKKEDQNQEEAAPAPNPPFGIPRPYVVPI